MLPLKPSPVAMVILLATAWTFGLSDSAPEATEATGALPTRVVREYVEEQQQSRYRQLLKEFGHNKVLPTGFELQTLLALSHFPELKNTHIRFVVADVNIPLSSRPHWASMHRSARNRTYLVVIDSQRDGDRKELLLRHQPFNAQTGIIGHELAHTVYYLDRSFFGILSDALCQLNDCRIEFERATDRRTVDYGLGWQRYDHSVFLRTNFGIDLETSLGPDSAYLGPQELLRLIETHPAYRDTLARY